jgi:hypothetical protein
MMVEIIIYIAHVEDREPLELYSILKVLEVVLIMVSLGPPEKSAVARFKNDTKSMQLRRTLLTKR